MQRRLCRVVAVFAAALAVVVGVGPAEAEGGFKAVGTLDRFPPEALDTFPELFQGSPFESRMLNGTLLLVPEADQLWQVYRSSAAGRSGVLVRNARNLEVIGSFTVDAILRRATVSVGYGAEWLHAVDGGRRVFLVDAANQLYEVDTTTLVPRPVGELSVTLPGLAGVDPLIVGGMTYDPATGRLLVLYGGPPNTTPANQVTVLQDYDPATGAKVNRVVRACTGPLPATDLAGDTLATRPLPAADVVYVPCQKDTSAPGVGMTSSSVVVRIPRATLADQRGEEASVVVGGPMDTALLDGAAGRITVLGADGTLHVVDVRAMTVLAAFPAALPGGTGRVGPGLDPETGRVFFQSDLGLGYVEARATPPFVGTVDSLAAAAAQEGIVASGHRIFVLRGHALEKAETFSVHKVGP